MNLIRTKTLSDAQILDVEKLCADCNLHDKTKLSFPIEYSAVYFLLYDEVMLLSALSAFSDENNCVECSAFTTPTHRQQGCFSRLLQELEEEADENDIVFVVDPSCVDSVKVMEALEAELWYEEYMMELDLSDLDARVMDTVAENSKIQMERLEQSENQNQEYIFKLNGTPIGSCQLSFRDFQVYFYHFEIHPELRGKGLGTECFKLVLDRLHDLYELHEPYSLHELKKNSSVLLQVSSDNLAAMALYQKAGFHITESLAYYLY